MSRYRMMSLAVSVVLDDDSSDEFVVGGIKRPRTHAFWMSPFLKARTNDRERNTLAKLEADFIRVSIQIENNKLNKLA